MVGTLKLLKPIHRNFVKGFLINKFRGDKSLLDPAIKSVEKITKKEILGIIPKINFDLPNEDSLDGTASNKSKLPKESWDSEINLLARKIRESIDVQKILSKVVGLER
jgi:adenosylcobyric acid synthase